MTSPIARGHRLHGLLCLCNKTARWACEEVATAACVLTEPVSICPSLIDLDYNSRLLGRISHWRRSGVLLYLWPAVSTIGRSPSLTKIRIFEYFLVQLNYFLSLTSSTESNLAPLAESMPIGSVNHANIMPIGSVNPTLGQTKGRI